MKLKTFLAAITLLLFCFVNGQAQVTVIKAGKLVDPATATTLINQVILVEGGKIKAIGANLTIPEGASVIDLSNATVLPGLFDAHTHLCSNIQYQWDGGDYLVHSLNWRTGMRALIGAKNASEMLDAGFTTVRDVGNAGDYADADLAKAIGWDMFPGPTMIVAGRIIAPFGGQFVKPVPKQVFDNPEYIFADSHDELRKAIRENIYYGAKVIKLVVDGYSRGYMYSTEDIKFAVDEARNAGLKVAAHAVTKRGAHNAAEAGVASIEHGWILDQEEFDLMKKNNVVLVSTDFTIKSLQAGGYSLEGARKNHEQKVARLKRAYQAGVTVVFGTDVMADLAGETRGTLAIGYIDSFVEAGVPNKDILQSLTNYAARLLGVEKQRGALAPGMYADIIATPENPLDNIQTLKKVSFVMKNGKVYKPNK
ncbi:MAG: amidohydrolase family protein [Acidobacteria bacterium]|nr:amidohydrolase family protein [Acidobacteriota bacterium]